MSGGLERMSEGICEEMDILVDRWHFRTSPVT